MLYLAQGRALPRWGGRIWVQGRGLVGSTVRLRLLLLGFLFQFLRLMYFLSFASCHPRTLLSIGFLAPGQCPWILFDTLLWLLRACVRACVLSVLV